MRDARPIRYFASNPAGARVNRLRYCRYYPTWPLLWLIVIACIVAVSVKVSLWFLLLLVPVLPCVCLYWILMGNRFINGDANPGIIVQLNPTLIAVMTDLRKGPGSYPAIKILRTRLGRILGQQPRLGMHLATVAHYLEDPRIPSPHWLSFDPRPLESGTGDRDTIRRVMDSFPRDQSDRLETAVQQLPSLEVGLYRQFDHGWEQVPDFSIADLLPPPLLWFATLAARVFP